MNCNFKYIDGKYNIEQYLKQVEKVNSMIVVRLNILASRCAVHSFGSGDSCKGRIDCVDLYIRATKGMSHETKMKWLSDVTGCDHGEWMREWTKLQDLDKYGATTDFERSKKFGIKLR